MLEKFFYSHYNIDMVKLYDHSLQLLVLGIFPKDKNGFRRTRLEMYLAVIGVFIKLRLFASVYAWYGRDLYTAYP